jgi:hypothetical protein
VGAIKKPRIDTMGGVEYYGIDDVVVALEMVNRHIFNFRNDMKPLFAQRDQVETAVRVTADLMNARLHLTALGLLFGIDAQDGSIVRLEASYDIRDALVAGGGIVLYQKGDLPPFTSIFRNDRLFFHLKYSF